MVSGLGVAIDQSKVKVVIDWPASKSIKWLKGFFRLICYYRNFIKDYGKIAKPLKICLKKGLMGGMLKRRRHSNNYAH